METYFKNNIEKLICPFDFSDTARAGLEYAGLLARALKASLTLFYVQPTIWPEALQLYEDQNDNERALRRLLKMEVQALRESLGIACDSVFERTIDTPEMAIGAFSADYDLIVMGTNGADDLYQHVFGTNTHHVLGLARCPVLMIPEAYKARLPKLIVYAFDPETNPVFLVTQLENLSRPLGAEVRTLHVLPNEDSSESIEKMELLGAMLGVKERKGFDWHFEPMYSDGVVAGVDAYMKEQEADVLALSYHHRTLFEKLFGENVIKAVSRIADYPILVFWH
jgi:nucleotide-binding universal stress UspA family protein